MKLHLPISLRKFLVAACFSVIPISASGFDVSGGYYIFNDVYDSTHEKHSTYYSLSDGKYVINPDTQKASWITYPLAGNFNWFYRSVTYQDHVCDTTNIMYTALRINENGGGQDMKWQCSTFDEEGNLQTPGVWIMSQCSQNSSAEFTNYGDMVVSDCRQQWYKQEINQIESAPGYSYGERELTDFETSTPFKEVTTNYGASLISNLSFDLKVTNSKSFTYKDAYTSNTGAFVSGFRNILFDNVQDITFSGNYAGYSGAIAYASDSFWTNITDDSGFVVRNVKGSVRFEDNSSQINYDGGLSGAGSRGGGLFRNYLVRFSDGNF